MYRFVDILLSQCYDGYESKIKECAIRRPNSVVWLHDWSMTKKRNLLLLLWEYFGVFLSFLLMYFFIWPQSDVFLFAQETDGTLASAFTFSVNYGNGRLLGNLIGVFFSRHFAFAGLITAVVLCGLVIILNILLFKNSIYSVFPLALLTALPSTGITKECYYLFAGFCNYVIPIALFLLSVCLVRYLCKQPTTPAVKMIGFFILFILGACSCLFSENTTITAAAAAIAMLFHAKKTRAHSAPQWTLLFSVLVGTAVMLLIPILTGSGHKMDGYRQIATGLPGIIRQCVVSFALFADALNHCYLLLFLFSFGMLLLCRKQTAGPRFLKYIQLAIFSVYPFLCFTLNSLDSHNILASQTMLNLPDAAIAILYICNILLTLILVDNKTAKLKYWLFTGITFFSIAPMMIVSISGHRTYYTTFICLLFFSLSLLRDGFPVQMIKTRYAKAFSAAAGACFAFLSLVLLMQSLCNYNFYVYRSNYMAQQINAGEPLRVPRMPCEAISIEEPLETTLFFAFQSDSGLEQTVVSLSSWEVFESYYEDIVNNPLNAVKFAFENLQYKDPLYPESLCKK